VADPTPEELQKEIKALRQELEEYRVASDLWKKAEAEWSRNKRLLRMIAENAADLIAVVDRSGTRIWNNSSYQQILGYSPEEMRGTYSMAEIHPDDLARVKAVFDDTIKTGAGQGLEYRMRHKNGSWVHLESQGRAVRDVNNEVEFIIVVARDISARKQMEEELSKAKQVESAALMAGGAAQEFGQILSSILQSITLARANASPGGVIHARLDDAEKAAQKARDYINKLYSIGKKDLQADTRPLSLPELVRETANAALRGTNVRQQCLFSADLYPVLADEENLRQAIKNILANSILSFSNPGFIQISGENCSLKKGEIGSLAAGNYVRLEIVDNGCGMSERVLARAFEPKFSTREGANGLGLTTALALIEKSKGALTLRSTLGVGTAAHIYLPAQASKVRTELLPRDIKQTVRRRILLMDDEAMIRDLVSRMLQHLGYDVLVSAEGMEAINLYRRAKDSGQPFDAVMFDLLIPGGMSGLDALSMLKQYDPNVRAILSSGQLDNPAVINYASHGFAGCIPKPYKIEKLQSVLQQVVS
jgi:two-component system cell cycle sensor histidine kinase/response regulator CckA